MTRLAVLLILLVSGCATIPDSGPVNKVTEPVGSRFNTQFTPAGPSPGDSPTEIVDGFLEAMLSFPADSTIAAAFLTPAAEEDWQIARRTTVYDSVLVKGTSEDEGQGLVTVQFARSAVLDEQGRFTSSQGAVDHSFRLSEVNGEWRITNPPVGKYVSSSYFATNYATRSLYFFNKTGTTLISDPVHVMESDNTPTQLLTALFAGASKVRNSQAVSFIAQDVSLRGTVEVVDGTALVRIKQPLNTFANPELAATQIAATLLPLPRINSVRVDGSDRDFKITSVSKFAAPPQPESVFAVLNGQLVTLDGAQSKVVPGFVKLKSAGIAVHKKAKAVAVLNSARNEVSIHDIADGEVKSTIQGEAIIKPVFDSAEQLWILDRVKGVTSVRLVKGAETQNIGAADLLGFKIDSFAVSPDLSRYAFTGQQSGKVVGVYVGAINSDSKGRVTSLGLPAEVRVQGASQFADISWLDETHLSLLATVDQTGRQPLVIGIDGSLVSFRNIPAAPANGAIATVLLGLGDKPAYIDVVGGTWFYTSNENWRLLQDVHLATRAW